jgi:hypothetical protein
MPGESMEPRDFTLVLMRHFKRTSHLAVGIPIAIGRQLAIGFNFGLRSSVFGLRTSVLLVLLKYAINVTELSITLSDQYSCMVD